MTPLPAPAFATTAAPPMAPRSKLSGRSGQPDGRPSFEAVRQNVAVTKAEDTAPTREPASDPGKDEAGQTPATSQAPLPAEQNAALQIAPLMSAALPQAGIASPESFAQAPVTRPAGLAAMTATAGASAFFEDIDSVSTDAGNFAADLLAALGSTTTSAPVAELKASATIGTPVTTDVAPELDMTSDVWLDQLARDIAATASADGKLSFRIVPQQLGQLDINIEARDAGVAVHMKTETREAQALIAAAQPRLESALGQNGIRVAETSVASNGQENLPKPHFTPQKALIEAVNDLEPEADTPTLGRAAGRFA